MKASDRERSQQERDDHAHADEHIGEKIAVPFSIIMAHAGGLHQCLCTVSRADGLPSSCIKVLLAFMGGKRDRPDDR
jgi:hypothetical protein